MQASGEVAGAVLPRASGAGGPPDGLEVICDPAGFNALAGEWPDFLARCEANHPFNTHWWLSSWNRHFGAGRPVEVLAVRREGRLVCCLPTIQGDALRLHRRRFRSRTLWVNTHSFRSGVLCDPAHLDALDLVADHLAAADDWDLMDLPYLPHGTRAEAALTAGLARRGIRAGSRPGMVSPRLAIQGPWDAYLKSLSRHRREALRQKRRRLLEKSGGRVEITRGRPDDLEARLEACWRISAHTWKHQNGSSIAADTERMAFYRDVAFDPSDWFVLGLLRVGDRPVAFEYDLSYGGVLYVLKLGYDEAYGRLSPGFVLRGEMLRWAHENGVRIFDYNGHAVEYTTRFSSDVLNHDNVRLYGRSAASRLLYAYEGRLKPVVRRLKRWAADRREGGEGA